MQARADPSGCRRLRPHTRKGYRAGCVRAPGRVASSVSRSRREKLPIIVTRHRQGGEVEP